MKVTKTEVDAALANMDADEMADALKRVLEVLYCEEGEGEVFDDEKPWTADTVQEIAEGLAADYGLSPESIGTKGGERV